MKTEVKIKKLTLNKETLRDLTAYHAGEVKGGGLRGLGNTKKCPKTGLPSGCLTWCRCPTNVCV